MQANFYKKISYKYGSGIVGKQYRQMFKEKNNEINAKRNIPLILVCCIISIVQFLLVLYDVFDLGQQDRIIGLIVYSVFAEVSLLLLAWGIIKRYRGNVGRIPTAIFNALCIFTVWGLSFFISIRLYPSMESMAFYIMAQFVFAMFFFLPMAISVYNCFCALTVYVIYIFYVDGIITQTISASVYATICFFVAWIGSRMMYNVRAKWFMTNVNEAELEQMSLTDSLLSIPNRRKFDVSLQLAWSYCSLEKKPLSLVMIDIDNFKLYNDRFGHSEGDKCLKMVVMTLKKSIRRESDVLARVGGEELAFLLPLTDGKDAMVLMEKARSAVERLRIKNPITPIGTVTISVGIASITPGIDKEITSHQALYEAADSAMYDAKKLGKNRVCRFSEYQYSTECLSR